MFNKKAMACGALGLLTFICSGTSHAEWVPVTKLSTRAPKFLLEECTYRLKVEHKKRYATLNTILPAVSLESGKVMIQGTAYTASQQISFGVPSGNFISMVTNNLVLEPSTIAGAPTRLQEVENAFNRSFGNEPAFEVTIDSALNVSTAARINTVGQISNGSMFWQVRMPITKAFTEKMVIEAECNGAN